MLQIKKLEKPGKKSGVKLDAGQGMDVMPFGVRITNLGKQPVYVDKVTPFYLRKGYKRPKKKKAA